MGKQPLYPHRPKSQARAISEIRQEGDEYAKLAESLNDLAKREEETSTTYRRLSYIARQLDMEGLHTILFKAGGDSRKKAEELTIRARDISPTLEVKHG